MKPTLLLGLLLLSNAALAQADAGAPPEVIVPPGASCPGLPEYPRSEIPSQRAGKVVVRVTIDEQGAASSIELASGMGEPFDTAALEATRRCAFTAATRNGAPVLSAIELSVDLIPPPIPAVIEGVVVGELGEPLAQAGVTAGEVSVLTDAQGRFRLEVAPPEDGRLWVMVAKGEYAEHPFAETLKPGEAVTRRYPLSKPKVYETRVTANRLLPDLPEVDKTPQVSRFQITRADIDRTPGALEDISRVVQDLPGVVADPDLMATFFVRGGGPEEVIYYLDGVPLSSPFHLGGFATVFNPMLISAAEFYAGGTPARYEPSLSGVLEVKYLSGETNRLKVQVDVSAHTAKALVNAPTGIDGLSFLVSARRSYFEGYFAVLKAIGVVGQNYVAPEIAEYLARVNYKRGAHQLTATFLHAQDGLNFLIKPGEQILFNFAGGLSLSNVVQVAMLQHRMALGGDSELTLTAAFTRDQNHTSVSGETLFARDAERREGIGKADLLLAFSERNRLRLGGQYSHRFFQFAGQVPDVRAVAPWSSTPFVDTGVANVDIAPAGLRDIFAAYAEHTWRPVDAFTLEGGMRVQADFGSAQATYALRAAASYAFPTATVAKLSFGAATQFQPNPVLLDPTYGNPGLQPERSIQLVAGIEQGLPFEALLRVEAFAKWLDHLTVNPDTPEGVQALLDAGQPAFQSTGKGFARGVDVLLLGRRRKWSYGVSFGLVFSDRTNPLAAGASTYPAPWDQRLTVAGHVSFTPTDTWILSARASAHTGRPVTPVVDFARDEARQRYVPVFGETNSARYGGYYDLSVRVEKRFTLGPLAMAWYVEALNVTNAKNIFATVYSDGDFAAGTLPEEGSFNHLPIRPFLGIRGEY